MITTSNISLYSSTSKIYFLICNTISENKESNDSDLVSLEGLEIRPARGGGADVGKVNWVIEGFVAVGIVLLAAEPGTGKTTLLYRAAEAIQEGKDFLDAVPVKKASVLVIQGDEPKNVVDRKIARMDLKGRFAMLCDFHTNDTQM